MMNNLDLLLLEEKAKAKIKQTLSGDLSSVMACIKYSKEYVLQNRDNITDLYDTFIDVSTQIVKENPTKEEEEHNDKEYFKALGIFLNRKLQIFTLYARREREQFLKIYNSYKKGNIETVKFFEFYSNLSELRIAQNQ